MPISSIDSFPACPPQGSGKIALFHATIHQYFLDLMQMFNPSATKHAIGRGGKLSCMFCCITSKIQSGVILILLWLCETWNILQNAKEYFGFHCAYHVPIQYEQVKQDLKFCFVLSFLVLKVISEIRICIFNIYRHFHKTRKTSSSVARFIER